jgi:hypothetical protein
MQGLTRLTAFATVSLLALPIMQARATEGGGTTVPLGVRTIATGVLQEPGDYLLTYNNWVTAHTLADGNGDNSLPGASLKVEAHSLRYVHVFQDLKIAGGNTSFEVATAYVKNSLSSAFVNGEDSGIGDTVFGPAIGWHSPQYHQLLSLLVVAPTGSYDAKRALNVGRNYYALQADYAGTWFFAPHWELSGMLKFVFNQKNKDTGYRSGTETTSDFAVNYHIDDNWFAGVGGYAHNQLTSDTINGVDYDGGHRVRDFAVGPQIGWGTRQYGIYLAWQKQLVARNTAKGDLVWLNAFVKF